MSFDPYNHSLKIWESIGTPTSKMGVHLGVWGFIPSHSFALPRAWDVTPGLPSWPATLQALALVASLRLGLRQIMQVGSNGKEHISVNWDHWWSKPFIKTNYTWNQVIRCNHRFPHQQGYFQCHFISKRSCHHWIILAYST